MAGAEALRPEEVLAAIQETGSVSGAAKALDVPRSTLRGFILRNKITLDGGYVVPPASDQRFVVIEGDRDYGDIAKLLAEDGLSPEDWHVARVRVNRWGDQRQLRVDLDPRTDLLVPARSDGWTPPKDAASRRVTDGLVFLFPDQHAPHHDEDLVAAAVQMVADLKPEQIVFLGDLLDYSGVSRHRKNGNEPSMQQTVDAAYGILRAVRAASPGSRIRLLEGNHEDRLKIGLIDRGLMPLVGLRRAQTDEASVWSSAHLLRLDELEIEQVFPPEGCSYEHAELRVFDNLAARHGHIAKAGSGVSGQAMLSKLRRNIVFGHTHRQSITYHTHWDINNEPHRLVAVEAGTMAKVDHTGLEYALCPDWQQGFAVAQKVGDQFSVDLATWSKDRLLWRDYEYRV